MQLVKYINFCFLGGWVIAALMCWKTRVFPVPLKHQLSLCLQLSRGWVWPQTSANGSSTRRRGRSLKTTPRRSVTVGHHKTLQNPTRERISADLKLVPVPAEQDERSRESIEQWREFHYDGLYPPQEYNRHSTWGPAELWTRTNIYRHTC